jgi:hypothetical protein
MRATTIFDPFSNQYLTLEIADKLSCAYGHQARAVDVEFVARGHFRLLCANGDVVIEIRPAE